MIITSPVSSSRELSNLLCKRIDDKEQEEKKKKVSHENRDTIHGLETKAGGNYKNGTWCQFVNYGKREKTRGSEFWLPNVCIQISYSFISA